MSVGNYMTYFYSSYTSNIVVLDIGAASGVNNYIGTWDVSYWRNYYSGGANFNGSAQSYIRDMKMGGSGTIWNFYGVEHGKTTKVEVGNLGNIGGSAWTFTVTAQWLASVMFTRTGGATTAANISIVINICGGARYINSDFGTGFTTFGAAQTCTYSVSSYYPRADFLNCKLPVNQAANWWVAGQSGAGPAGMSKSLYIPYVTLQNCTDAAGGAIPDTVALGTYYAAIMLDMYKEPTTFKTVAPSLGFKGTGANNWHRYGPIKIKGKATKLTTVSFQCRKNASYGSSNLPYVELHYFDASGLQMNVATMTDTNDTWVPLSVAGTPAYDRDLDLYLWVYGCNTVSMRCYLDDIAVTVAT